MDKSNSTKKEERRMSSSGAFAGPLPKDTSKENKRPLITVFSEDRLGANTGTASTSTTQGNDSNNNTSNVSQKQSFLSRFASAEAKSSIAAAAAAFDQNAPPSGSKAITTTKNNIVLPETQCDNNKSKQTTPKTGAPSISNKSKSGDDQGRHRNKGPPQERIKQVTTTKPTERTKLDQQQQQQQQKATLSNDEDDDNDQVLPVWPSRIEARSMEPAVIQHQVYSLKDYSQVSGPSKTIGPPPVATSASTSGRLLKSMSQDRKVKANTKRMSECIYSSQQNAYVPHSSSNDNESAGLKQRNSTIMDQVIPSGSFSIGPSTSVNSLLAPTAKNTALLSESRIDRMRKLFVSPLSLRSSGAGAKLGSHGQPTGAPDNNPRLSLQGGANMLNKPQHLMHAMYRTRAHHNRRSPMRQKQSATKGFRVYGCPLQMANNIYPITCFGRPDIYKQQSVPYILARLCNYIEETSSKLTHEGIFRVSGNARLMEKLRTLFDRLGDAPLESESVDVATSASMLKMYLRELPEPLIPARMNYYFIALAKKYSSLLAKDNMSDFKAFDNAMNPTSSRNSTVGSTGSYVGGDGSTIGGGISSASQIALDQQRAAYKRDLTKLVRKLPIENYNLLKYLACFLYRISLKQQYNKMCAEALGIVFGPNVFRIRSESYKGLKEQELSNQIMASIISNYKSIFDCELTDPLGNLVGSSEDLRMPQADEQNSNQTSSTIEADSKLQTSKPSVMSSPLASTSVSTSDQQQLDSCNQALACPKHDRICYYHEKVAQLSEEDADDDNGDDVEEEGDDGSGDDSEDDDDEEEDDDEEDCDDESYSPSSGSSYCSSIESDTVESTYDEDDEQVGTRKRYADVDNSDDIVTDSSSECGSDTNYTPSSSHTDSDLDDDDDDDRADESPYYKSSSFDSSSSFGRVRDGQVRSETGPVGGGVTKVNSSAQTQPQSDNPCRVCKRRESAQIEANQRRLIEAQLRQTEQQQVNQPTTGSTCASLTLSGEAVTSTSATEINAADDNELPTSTTTITTVGASDIVQSDNVKSDDEPIDETTETNRDIVSTRLHNKSTRRRKHPEEGKKLIEHLKKDLAVNKTSSDQTLNQRDNSTAKSRGLGDGFSRRQQSRLAQKHNLLRRRSSSASSLLRIKSRNGQLIAKKTFAAKADDQNHHPPPPPPHHHHKARFSHSERRKPPELKSYHRKSRKSHITRRGEQYSSSTRATSSKRAGAACHDTKQIQQQQQKEQQRQQQQQQQQQQQIERVTSLEPKNLVWDYATASLLGIPGCEGMFLRSYNSDETLLRTSEDYNDTDNIPERNNTRRFSDHEHLMIRKNVIPVCGPFGEIFEALEGEPSIDLLEDQEHDPVDQEARTRYEQHHHLQQDQHQPQHLDTVDRLGIVEASTISLLDDRITNFRHSNLSIEDHSHEDIMVALLNQLKSTKDLIDVLRMQLKSDKMRPHLSTMFDDNITGADHHSDDWSLCHLDHLSAKSLIERLTSSSQSDLDGESEDAHKQEQIIAIINNKLIQLKERYNSSKIIYEHCKRHHPTGTTSKSNHSPTIGERTEEIHDSAIGANPNSQSIGKDKRTTLSAEGITDLGSSSDSLTQMARATLGELEVEARVSRSSPSSPLRRPVALPTALPSGSITQETQSSLVCKFGSLCPVEFVFNMEKQLALKQMISDRLVKLNEMSLDQLQSEKLDLQKNLLRFEHWFGRPSTRLELQITGHLYERYRAVKSIKHQRQIQ